MIHLVKCRQCQQPGQYDLQGMTSPEVREMFTEVFACSSDVRPNVHSATTKGIATQRHRAVYSSAFSLDQGWNCWGLNPQFMSTDAHF